MRGRLEFEQFKMQVVGQGQDLITEIFSDQLYMTEVALKQAIADRYNAAPGDPDIQVIFETWVTSNMIKSSDGVHWEPDF